MHWKPDAGLPAGGLKVHFGMDGTSISRGQKQQSCGKSAKPTGLRPEPGTQGKMQRTHPRNEDPYAT